MSIIRHERKIKLSFEHHKYLDVRRWNIAHTLFNNTPIHAHHPLPIWEKGKPTSKMSYIFKIDQTANRPTRTFLNTTYYFRIDNSGANSYLIQNPGY